ncbi:MAG: hypothetical protein NVSMB52_10880 [Chloroflexota bacterium]
MDHMDDMDLELVADKGMMDEGMDRSQVRDSGGRLHKRGNGSVALQNAMQRYDRS